MCGICGIFHVSPAKERVSPDNVLRMRETLVHRGPDDAGYYVSHDGRVGLGHRRLSIIDLSPAGRQPMANEDGTVWITFNGEIYNHRRLRRDLEVKGHVYRSQTDTETILHLYEEKGVRCVEDLEGMFAFALWDGRRGCMVLARDRLGIKPLYYRLKDGMLLFGSEIKAILAHPDVGREINSEGLYHYLTFGTVPAPLTLFQEIRKLEPGTLLIFQTDGSCREVCYWDAISPPSPRDGESYGESIRSLLAEATRKRMMSDVPFGAFLSGGVDSSLTVALMSRFLDRPVDTFSVGFRPSRDDGSPGEDELAYARLAARTFKTHHHELVINSGDLWAGLTRMVEYLDDPFAAPEGLFFECIVEMARRSGVIVAQVGEGSDEIFLGYPWNFQFLESYRRRWRYLAELPSPLRRPLVSLAGQLMTGNGRLDDRAENLRRLSQDQPLYWGRSLLLSEPQKRALLSPEFLRQCYRLDSGHIVQDYYRRLQDAKPGAHFVDQMTYLDLKIWLAELLLMRVDKISMAHGVEVRVPFLDHKLVEFVLSTPPELRIGNGPKSLLKEEARGMIPPEIVDRPKVGFGAPLLPWLGEALRYLSPRVLRESRIRQTGYFRLDALDEISLGLRWAKGSDLYRLWGLTVLFLWFDRWVENRKGELPVPARIGGGVATR